MNCIAGINWFAGMPFNVWMFLYTSSVNFGFELAGLDDSFCATAPAVTNVTKTELITNARNTRPMTRSPKSGSVADGWPCSIDAPSPALARALLRNPLNYRIRPRRNFQCGLAPATGWLRQRLRSDLLRRFKTVDRLQVVSGQHHRTRHPRWSIRFKIDLDSVSVREVAIQDKQRSRSIPRIECARNVHIRNVTHTGHLVMRRIHQHIKAHP